MNFSTRANLLVPLALLLGACSTGNNDAPSTGPENTSRTLELDSSDLPALGDDFVYEGWIIADGEPHSTGRFSVDEWGTADVDVFELDAELADSGEVFVLTIEPAVGDDPAPASTHLLAGAFDENLADISVNHPAALGTDFASVSGSYILETPTTADVAEDYTQGIWWIDVSDGPAPALDLPELPEGWVYEGWVVGEDGPVSTGRFSYANEADSDGAGWTAGPDDAPPFPGQDFIDPAVNLVGMTAVITVEPQPDNSPAPFAIKPLIDMEIVDVGRAVLQDLDNQASPLPRAVVNIVR